MKYKLLKHIDNEDWNEIELWKTFELNTEYFHFNDWKTCPIDFLIREWYIVKIDFKVWDYLVREDWNCTSYIRIYSITNSSEWWQYINWINTEE